MDLDSDFWVPQRSTTEVKLGGAFHVGVEVLWDGVVRKAQIELSGFVRVGLLRPALQFTFPKKSVFSLDWFVGENLQATMVFTCIYHEM